MSDRDTRRSGPISSRSSHTWLVGYVRGSASGYRRGTVSLRRVTSSVLLALANGVPEGDLSDILTSHALQWKPERGVVVDGGALGQVFDD